MRLLKGTEGFIPILRNCLLVVCLVYIAGSWILSSGAPDLDEVVLEVLPRQRLLDLRCAGWPRRCDGGLFISLLRA